MMIIIEYEEKTIIVSGYFNPLHKGHIEYLKNAKNLAHELFVIVNNDFQRELKGSKEFMDERERVLIVSNLKMVDKCYLSIDTDKSVSKTIRKIYNELSSDYFLAFGNGGSNKQ